MSTTEELMTARAPDVEEIEQEPVAEQQVEEHLREPEPQIAISPIKKDAENSPKSSSYYQTQYNSPREFDFRMSSLKAQGLACGPTNRGLLAQVVLPADHPAASPMLIEDAVALTAARLLEAGMEVKMDNQMEKSMKSMIESCLHARDVSQKTQSFKSKSKDFIANYGRMIAALQAYPNLQKEPIKLDALQTLTDAVKNKTEIPGVQFKKILQLCLELKFVDRKQASEFVDRMKKTKMLNEEQSVAVLKEAEPKYVNGKIKLAELQRLVESRGMKGSKKLGLTFS